MEKEDKVAFTIILVILGVAIFGTMWGLKVVGGYLFGWFVSVGSGVGLKDALFYSIILSVIIMVTFAIVAGDGMAGELTSMVLGFFLFVIFFTFSIAWIF